MPIYAYRCESCGHTKDVLQKVSDAPLTQCPHCGAEAFKKQVTAAGFQLKGSGWYVTDFRGGSGSSTSAAAASAGGGSAAAAAPDASSSTSSSSSADSSAPTSTASTGGGCGSSCDCH